MSFLMIFVYLLISILIGLGLVYLSFKFADFSKDDLAEDIPLQFHSPLLLQIGYCEARAWR